MERENFICLCSSEEHQLSFYYDKEDKELIISIHLYSHKSILKRLIAGLKFAFGYRCKYGEWDSVILDSDKIKEYLIDK